LTVQRVEIFDFEKFAIRDIKLPPVLREGTYPINQATVISASALDEIKYILKNRLIETTDYGVETISDKALKGIMDEIGTEWTTKQGNWPKRFAKVFKNRRGQKFDSDFLSRIGKIARESCSESTGKELIVTREFAWDPGEYGDHDSCFWGCRSGAKKILRMAKGYALLIHGDESRPLGRAWCVPYESHHIIFNAYARSGESITIVAFARILSDIFNYAYYRNVRLTCRDTDEGPLWINNGKGYIVGSQEVKDIESVDLDYVIHCDECGEECTYEAHLEDNGDVVCEDCYKGSRTCESCERRMHDDDTYWVHDTAICPRCYDNDCYQCHHCGEHDWNDNATEYKGRLYCEYCVDTRFERCEKCDTLIYKDDVIDVQDDAYCPKCAEEHTFECDECGERFDYANEEIGSEKDLCNACYYDKYPDERPSAKAI
jgi:formylmethanofuran dehydrogenase subunit E